MSFYIQKGRLRKTSPLFGCLLFNLFLCVGWLPIDVYIFGALGIFSRSANFTFSRGWATLAKMQI